MTTPHQDHIHAATGCRRALLAGHADIDMDDGMRRAPDASREVPGALAGVTR